MATFIRRKIPLKSIKYIFNTRRCTGMYFCTKPPPSFSCVLLEGRGHIEVVGKDSVKFLQGLLTNDVNLFHCDSQMSALFAMMLNTKGRVLYDLLLYKLQETSDIPGFLLECDLKAVDNIITTFKPYKLRSKVTFTDVSESFNSWCITEEGSLEGLQRTEKDSDGIILVNDPRIRSLGARLVLPKTDLPTQYFSNIKEISDQGVYDRQRVSLGVGEGTKDLEPGVPLPLQYNTTELHGVSYHKGCYIGQELTARTYYTGVLRKRLMPIKLQFSDNQQGVDMKGAAIKTTAGKAAGKVISVYETLGLALMKLDVVRSADELSVVMPDGKNVVVTATWPSWWNLD